MRPQSFIRSRKMEWKSFIIKIQSLCHSLTLSVPLPPLLRLSLYHTLLPVWFPNSKWKFGSGHKVTYCLSSIICIVYTKNKNRSSPSRTDHWSVSSVGGQKIMKRNSNRSSSKFTVSPHRNQKRLPLANESKSKNAVVDWNELVSCSHRPVDNNNKNRKREQLFGCGLARSHVSSNSQINGSDNDLSQKPIGERARDGRWSVFVCAAQCTSGTFGRKSAEPLYYTLSVRKVLHWIMLLPIHSLAPSLSFIRCATSAASLLLHCSFW